MEITAAERRERKKRQQKKQQQPQHPGGAPVVPELATALPGGTDAPAQASSAPPPRPTQESSDPTMSSQSPSDSGRAATVRLGRPEPSPLAMTRLSQYVGHLAGSMQAEQQQKPSRPKLSPAGTYNPKYGLTAVMHLLPCSTWAAMPQALRLPKSERGVAPPSSNGSAETRVLPPPESLAPATFTASELFAATLYAIASADETVTAALALLPPTSYHVTFTGMEYVLADTAAPQGESARRLWAAQRDIDRATAAFFTAPNHCTIDDSALHRALQGCSTRVPPPSPFLVSDAAPAAIPPSSPPQCVNEASADSAPQSDVTNEKSMSWQAARVLPFSLTLDEAHYAKSLHPTAMALDGAPIDAEAEEELHRCTAAVRAQLGGPPRRQAYHMTVGYYHRKAPKDARMAATIACVRAAEMAAEIVARVTGVSLLRRDKSAAVAVDFQAPEICAYESMEHFTPIF